MPKVGIFWVFGVFFRNKKESFVAQSTGGEKTLD